LLPSFPTLQGMLMRESEPVTGLLLTGGGARAAYQVGVLKAIAQLRRDCGVTTGNPFPVIAGTSAGAINAAALACRADDFDGGVRSLVQVWENFSADQVYRSDALGVLQTGVRWLTMLSIGWVIARWRKAQPKSLLDNAPLAKLLEGMLPDGRLAEMLRQGYLKALSVSASSYSSGLHVTFYEALADIQPWHRTQRTAVKGRITPAHLLASAAIPLVFPAVPLMLGETLEYFGDGSMRQVAPISPLIHLGAEKILVIGAGRMLEPPGRRATSPESPNLAQIAGHALSTIFLDALAVDVERLERVNQTVALLSPEVRAAAKLRAIEVLVIAPSQRLDDMATRHLGSLPTPVRVLLRGVGVSGRGTATRGAVLASYLLFEAPYTQELIALGVADTLARRDEVIGFFGWPQHQPSAALPRRC
jgi:NTE family protein